MLCGVCTALCGVCMAKSFQLGEKVRIKQDKCPECVGQYGVIAAIEEIHSPPQLIIEFLQPIRINSMVFEAMRFYENQLESLL